MKIIASIKKTNSKWKAASEAKLKNAVKALNRGALKIHRDIIMSMVAPKSGREYERGSKTHTASAPGEAPARDTGHLGQTTTFNLINVSEASNASVAEVVVSAEYALALEFGREDGSIAPRPFVRPAFAKNKKAITDEVRKALGS